jgi:hypothetical protein
LLRPLGVEKAVLIGAFGSKDDDEHA